MSFEMQTQRPERLTTFGQDFEKYFSLGQPFLSFKRGTLTANSQIKWNSGLRSVGLKVVLSSLFQLLRIDAGSYSQGWTQRTRWLICTDLSNSRLKQGCSFPPLKSLPSSLAFSKAKLWNKNGDFFFKGENLGPEMEYVLWRLLFLSQILGGLCPLALAFASTVSFIVGRCFKVI